MRHLLLSLLLFLSASVPINAQEDELLQADQAFKFKANVVDNEILLDWDIAKGYYLYKEKIGISVNPPARLGVAKFPKAKIKNDEFFGVVGTYRNQITVHVPVLSDEKSILLNVTYQGCADLGVCYPPVNKTVALNIDTLVSPVANQTSNSFSTAKNTAESMFKTIAPVEDGPLPPEQAFELSVSATDANTLVAVWQIKPDYYLYHDKFAFEIRGAELGDINFPKGKIKDDDLFGKVEVHKKHLEVIIPLKNIQTNKLSFTANYQGCWEGGVCYPPQQETIEIILDTEKNIQTVATTVSTPTAVIANQDANIELNETDQIAALFQQDNLLWVLISFFGFGLLLSLTPCVFPMIPILSGIIVGQKNITTRKALLMSIVFVLAMSITYAGAGVLAGYFGQNLSVLFQTPWILVTFSLVFVALAFSMFGYYEIQLPASLQNKITHISNKQEGGHLIGVAIMGLLSALIVGPCVAPPLAGALIYIGQTGDAVLGGLALFVMSLGMGAPLLAVGAGVSKLPKAGGWMDNVKAIFGILMLAVAIYLLDRIISPLTSLILWASLFTIAPIAMGVLENVNTPWQRIFKALGLIVLGYGVLIWMLVARGGGDMLTPLAGYGTSSAQIEQAHVKFEKITSTADLDQILAQAKQNKQIVMLDFYADWCISCKELERFVFSNSDVVDAMRNVRALQADVTKNNADDKALMARFNIIGPPGILFFKDGVEIQSKRIIGEISAQDFVQQLSTLIQK